MSENLVYADLNLTESGRPGLEKIIDVPGSTYAEVKVKSLDTNAAAGYTSPGPCCHTHTKNIKDSRRGKSCCSRTGVTALVAVVILLLVLAVCLVFMYHPTTSSPQDSKTLSTTYEEALGCPRDWEKNGRKCYFFFPNEEKKTWNDSRKECAAKGSDLVTIDNEEELAYLKSRSMGYYYLLGLTYSKSKKKWKWINGMEHNTDMFKINNTYPDYLCSVIGHGEVAATSCNGATTTKNMCEKSCCFRRAKRELKTRDPVSNVIPRFL